MLHSSFNKLAESIWIAAPLGILGVSTQDSSILSSIVSAVLRFSEDPTVDRQHMIAVVFQACTAMPLFNPHHDIISVFRTLGRRLAKSLNEHNMTTTSS